MAAFSGSWRILQSAAAPIRANSKTLGQHFGLCGTRLPNCFTLALSKMPMSGWQSDSFRPFGPIKAETLAAVGRLDA